MASQITIRSTAGVRRTLPFEVLSEYDLGYGIHDAYGRLQEDEIKNGPVVLYNPEHIGRGIEVNWNDNIRDEIHLSLPLPCTIHDIDVLYRVTARIMEYWQVNSFIQDGNVFNLEVVDALKKMFIDYCIAALKETGDNRHGDSVIIYPAVKNPLYLSVPQLTEFGEDQDMEGFSLLLHQLQERDLYYASPILYNDKEGKLFGAYAIVASTDTVLPYKRHPSPFARDARTGDPIECDLFVASLTSMQKRKRLATISYQDFLKEIDVSSLEKYDEAHFILPGLSEDEIERIASQGYPNPLEYS